MKSASEGFIRDDNASTKDISGYIGVGWERSIDEDLDASSDRFEYERSGLNVEVTDWSNPEQLADMSRCHV